MAGKAFRIGLNRDTISKERIHVPVRLLLGISGVWSPRIPDVDRENHGAGPARSRRSTSVRFPRAATCGWCTAARNRTTEATDVSVP